MSDLSPECSTEADVNQFEFMGSRTNSKSRQSAFSSAFFSGFFEPSQSERLTASGVMLRGPGAARRPAAV